MLILFILEEVSPIYTVKYAHCGICVCVCSYFRMNFSVIICLCLPWIQIAWRCDAFTLKHRDCNNIIKRLHDFTSVPDHIDRRSFFFITGFIVASPPTIASAILGPLARDVEVGGGFDLLGDTRLKQKDVLYPTSMEGPWICKRVVTQVDGDSFQAESVHRLLGGTKGLQPKLSETYQTRFLSSPFFPIGDGVVNDRGFEIASRTKSANVSWNVESPDSTKYDKVSIVVVQRKVENPSDMGFGFNELLRFEDGIVTRAAQIKRRYRRGFDENGNRIVEGLEIIKTYRVLDGVAGTEFPTSTTKSTIRLLRPS